MRPVAKKFFSSGHLLSVQPEITRFLVWTSSFFADSDYQFITVRPVAKNVFLWTSCFFTDRDSNVPRSVRPVAKNVLCGPVRRQRMYQGL